MPENDTKSSGTIQGQSLSQAPPAPLQRHLSFQNIKCDKRPTISDKINQQRLRSPSLQVSSNCSNTFNVSQSSQLSPTGREKEKEKKLAAISNSQRKTNVNPPVLNVHQDSDIPKSCLSSTTDVPNLMNVHPSFKLDRKSDCTQKSDQPNIHESNIEFQHNTSHVEPVLNHLRKNSIQNSNPIFKFLNRENDNKIHLLIGITGCISASKIIILINKLFETYTADKISIQIILTPKSEFFIKPCLGKINPLVKIWFNSDEFDIMQSNNNLNIKNTFENSMLHIELRRWADILLLAPLSANSLAKIVNGINDNLLTNVIRSWNPKKEIIAALGINNLMYSHPITQRQLRILKEDFPFMTILKPVEKISDYNGNISMGGMRECVDIVDVLTKKIGSQIDNDEDNDNENGIDNNDSDVYHDKNRKSIDFTLNDSSASNSESEDSEYLSLEDDDKRLFNHPVLSLEKVESI